MVAWGLAEPKKRGISLAGALASRVLVAFNLRRLLTWERKEVELRSIEAAHVHGERLPSFLAAHTVDVSEGPILSPVLGNADREHALVEEVELLDGFLQIIDVLAQGGHLLLEVIEPVLGGGRGLCGLCFDAAERGQRHIGGAILAPGKRCVVPALRAVGSEDEGRFCRYPRVLSLVVWSSKEASRLLLGLQHSWPRERRRERKISAKGIYRYLGSDLATTTSSKRVLRGGYA